ncbi:MAG TPA: ATPase domain-containing protein, partial [Candidatus Nanopelagicales bacterium]|nr:ATPase domain-containing protein [Candidatus Nanopelagicales bacterium]
MIGEEPSPSPPPPRLSTGIPGLDVLLGGGLVPGGLYLVEGMPGTGKTILANQICFHCARSGGRALYVTLLAESHGKMLAHIRPLSFFDEAQVFQSVIYLSGYRVLAEKGPSGFLALLAGAVREHKPSFLVIDGVRSARAFTETDTGFAVFIHEFNTFITTVQCTALLLAPLDRDKQQAEHALVDGMIELDRVKIGLRTVREIEIHKQRGAPHIYGRHMFRIGSEGLTVFPRLEGMAAAAPPASIPAEDRRLTFDLPQFDEMVGGGVFTGSTTSLVGPPGAGKTLLGLKFLEAGVRRGEACLYFGFYETPERLLFKAEHVGIEIAGAVSAGTLRLIWYAPVEQILDELAQILLADVRERRVRRVFIDGLDGFRDAAAYINRVPSFLIALMSALRAHGATTLVTEESSSPAVDIRPPIEDLSAVVENLVLMRYFEVGAEVHRLISVSKIRDSHHDMTLREFHITPRGIAIAASSESAEALIQQQAGAPPNTGKRR